jgi:hypothetical protein
MTALCHTATNFSLISAASLSSRREGNIGPGYAHMQPINEGKPDKVLYTTPYTMPARTHVVAKAKHVPSSIEALIAQSGLSVCVAEVGAPRFPPDLHRIY